MVSNGVWYRYSMKSPFGFDISGAPKFRCSDIFRVESPMFLPLHPRPSSFKPAVRSTPPSSLQQVVTGCHLLRIACNRPVMS